MAIKKQLIKTINYFTDLPDIAEISGCDQTKIEHATFPNAYIMVSKTNYDKGLGTIDFRAEIFSDEQKTYVIGDRRGTFIPDLSTNAENFVTQTYNHLKTLAEFEGAIDC